ncbi:MAG: hypothetical protein ACTTH5_08705 [Wolinella sp.]
MSRAFCLGGVFLVLLLNGCGSKRHFEPEEIKGKMHFDGKIRSSILSSHREGAMLKDGRFITREGIQAFTLPKGFSFLNDSERYYLATNEMGMLRLFPKDSHGEVLELKFEAKPLSARVEGDLLALVLANNSLVLYQISTQKELFSERGDHAVALNTLIASPLFLSDLILFPTLDGKLVIMDRESRKIVRNIIVHSDSGDSHFNNVIFLDVLGNRLVAATPKRVISVSPESINTYEANIRDVLFLRERIYVFTTEGRVILTDLDLNVMRSLKFPFAHFSGVSHGKQIYVLEKRGYLVALDVDLLGSSVYKLPSDIDTPIFSSGNRFYIDNRYFEPTE